MDFSSIIKTIDNDHYFDRIEWYRDILKCDYDLICKDDFGIIIEYRKSLFGKKIGHSRGGIRFNKKEKTVENFQAFVQFLKQELKKKDYILLGMDVVEGQNEYTQIFKPGNFYRESMNGTVFIFPKQDWIKKFNSKKRYDLISGEKKDVTIEITTNTLNDKNSTLDKNVLEKIHDLIAGSYKRHNSAFVVPSTEMLKAIFDNVNYVLAFAKHNGEIIAVNISIFNPNKTVIERVYAGANADALRLRAPSLLEVKIIEFFSEQNIQKYDLWGIKNDESDGVTMFKKSLGDETVYYSEYLLLVINPLLAFLSINLARFAKLIGMRF